MKIYTRRGDGGETVLADGRRLAKSDCQIEELGVLDELNAALGLLRAHLPPLTADDALLATAQDLCLAFGAAVAGAPADGLTALPVLESAVKDLEGRLDQLTAALPPLQNFILPGGSVPAAFAHAARAACRRAERTLAGPPPIIPLAYLNRLSDYLFTLARELNRRAAVPDAVWLGKKKYDKV